MLGSVPTLRCLMSEDNEIIYRECEKGNNVIFRDYRQPIYVLHMDNRKKIFSNIQELRLCHSLNLSVQKAETVKHK